MIMDPALAQLLEEHKRYFSILPDGKVKCEINGHQFPPRLDVATAFIKGNKFAKLKKRYDAEHSLEKYEPFILQSANFPNMLYCALTGQLMDKSLDAVKKHIQGKRFQNKKARFAADQLELKDEPDIDTLLAEITGRSVGKKKKKGEEAEEGSGGGSEDGEGSEDEESGQSEGDEEGMSEDEEPVAGKGAKEASKPREGKQVKLTPAQTEAAPDAAQKGKQQKREKQGGKGADAGSSGLAGSKRKREKEAKGPGVGVVKEQQQVGKAKGIEKRLQQQQQQQQQEAEGADEDEEPELWVPEEFAGIERTMAEPSTSDPGMVEPSGSGKGVGNGKVGKGKAGQVARGKGKDAKQAESDDFEFSDVESEEPAAAAGDKAPTNSKIHGKGPKQQQQQQQQQHSGPSVTAGKKGAGTGGKAGGRKGAPPNAASQAAAKSPKQNINRPSKAKKAKKAEGQGR
uniref:Surfeit locus protein 2 n=1 Tax=Dunaliella tertiolecta TaxID=3047 RepID=A0A7S3R1T3_DUNTE